MAQNFDKILADMKKQSRELEKLKQMAEASQRLNKSAMAQAEKARKALADDEDV